MDQGAQIVFLNGASSSGKSSIARQLLLVLGRPYFHFSVDAFHAMRAAEPTEPIDERTVLGFHRAVAGMAAAGNDIVVDHALDQPRWFTDCVDTWREHDVVFVGVHCSLPELNRRERLRDDRETGLAARQFRSVHSHGGYDLECDTEVNHPRDCAMQIKDFLAEGDRRRVFAELVSESIPDPSAEPDGARI
ncbi:MAG TPA: AAA family ATPase [Pseudonocardiaceae bacterium]